jgi:hypothetical protein
MSKLECSLPSFFKWSILSMCTNAKLITFIAKYIGFTGNVGIGGNVPSIEFDVFIPEFVGEADEKKALESEL